MKKQKTCFCVLVTLNNMFWKVYMLYDLLYGLICFIQVPGPWKLEVCAKGMFDNHPRKKQEIKI